jgi:hypothetical protein
VFIQDPVRAYQQPINPWDTKGRVQIGDFVLVTQGEFAGREGFVKLVSNDSNLVVETTQELDQPLVIIEGRHAEVQAVSDRSAFFLPTYSFSTRRHSPFLLGPRSFMIASSYMILSKW